MTTRYGSPRLLLPWAKRVVRLVEESVRGKVALAPPQALPTMAALAPNTSASPPQQQLGHQEANPCPLIPENLQWLLIHCPAFPISGSKVRVISDPQEFYQELLDKASSASQRISISSLYLGTGKLEGQLVATVGKRLAACGDSLQVRWLLDYTRGSRGPHNSRSMLRPLLSHHPQACSVSLYHTPQLRGLLRWLIPQRWNETIGLQHMKLYVFDDSLIISGANLSNDYFTNRQDRYFVFERCPDLATFYHTLIKTVSQFSLQLHQDDSTSMLPHMSVHPYLGDSGKYCSAMREAVRGMWSAECAKTWGRLRSMAQKNEAAAGSLTSGSDTGAASDHHLDTLVFPTLQMGPFGFTNDSFVTKEFLITAESKSRILVASGYFNLTEEYMNCVLHHSKACYSILMAHPQANGFLGAGGFAGAIPSAYTHLAQLFFRRVEECGQQGRVSLSEYRRPGWTYHAKGLWYYQPHHHLPCLSLVGSPNFGWRSVSRDLESQVLVVTQHRGLMEALRKEHQRLFSEGSQVSQETFSAPDRAVPFWVRCVMPIIKVFF